ncbi:hypothetical protein [Actinomadura rudentiformis]|uniref:Uncharacterized protein n=1 Tax=Actinomadura rudentiformis TaxID=359158 RepID=A0A6H9Z268_9ACTN|nr:hypothetical protein [Actinomadura rudentiformis]KAB2347357.1 hypothetical protein F8566_20305 [Actinomadura rudentiformis]
MASSVTAREPAWLDGVPVDGAEMRAAVTGLLYPSAGVVRGIFPAQIPTPAMQIRVPAGLSVVSDGQNGLLPLELAATTDLDIAASSPTQPRIDSLIAEFTDNGASSLYRYRVLTGTPAASPSAPALPPADQLTAKTLRVSNIAVAANATNIVDANITPQASQVYLGGIGGQWTNYAPTWSSTGTQPAIGNGLLNGRYMKVGRTVHWTVVIVPGSTTTFGTGAYRVSVPFQSANAVAVGELCVVGATRWQGQYEIVPNGTVAALYFPTSATDCRLTVWSPTVPLTFANGNTFLLSGTYEAAT